MTTLADFRTYVIRTFKRDDKNTEIDEALKETIKDVATRHSFQVLQFQSYVSVIAGQEDYPLPTDLLHLHHPIRYLEGSATTDEGYPLKRLTKEQYDWYESNPNRTNPDTGDVWGYTVYNNEIFLVGIPDTAAQTSGALLEINWSKQPTMPSLEGDTAHPFGDTWDETIKWGVLSRLYDALGLHDEAKVWAMYFEVGRPVAIGRTGVREYVGGIANMIQLDQRQVDLPLVMKPNNL